MTALALMVSPAHADATSEMRALRQQLEELTRQQEESRRVINALNQRLSQMEAGTPGAAAPAANRAQPAASPAPAAPPPTPASTAADGRRDPAPSPAIETLLQEEQGFFGPGLSLETGITYSNFSRAQISLSGFLALDAIFLGNISVDEIDADVITADVTARYGITDRMQLDLNLPFVYRSSTFQSGGAGGSSAAQIESTVRSGPNLGDASLGLSYRLFDETRTWPDLVLNTRVKAPTGTSPFGIELVDVPGSEGNLRVPKELPTGSGTWSASAGLSAVKTLDPVVFFGSITYFYNFAGSFDDIDAAPGKQPGRVNPGNAFQYGAGLAVALNEWTSLSLSYSQRFGGKTEIQRDGQPASPVIGSDSNVAMLGLGVTVALSNRLSLVANASIGLTADAPDVQVGVRIPYSF